MINFKRKGGKIIAFYRRKRYTLPLTPLLLLASAGDAVAQKAARSVYRPIFGLVPDRPSTHLVALYCAANELHLTLKKTRQTLSHEIVQELLDRQVRQQIIEDLVGPISPQFNRTQISKLLRMLALVDGRHSRTTLDLPRPFTTTKENQ